MTALDAVAADVKDIALVKLDVEGWEPRVIGEATERMSVDRAGTREPVAALNTTAAATVSLLWHKRSCAQ
jgi:hypothetical protein